MAIAAQTDAWLALKWNSYNCDQIFLSAGPAQEVKT